MEDYEKLHYLGSGSFGSVYAYRHKGWKMVAGKKLRCDKEDQLADVMREMMSMSKLEHCNVVQVLDVAVKKKNEAFCVWLFMEFCNEGTLSDYMLKENRMESMPLKVSMVTHVAEALKYLHGKKIVHRDLKPANILVTSESGEAVAKISDFGSAKICDTLKRGMASYVGSIAFMAPEVKKMGEFTESTFQPYNEKCDVFSLGTILLALLTNAMLNGSICYTEGKEALCVHMNHYKKIPDSIPHKLSKFPELKHVVISMLAYGPGERPSAARLVSDFGKVLSSSKVDSKSHSEKKTEKSERQAVPSHRKVSGESEDEDDDDDDNIMVTMSQIALQVKSSDSSTVKPPFWRLPATNETQSVPSGRHKQRDKGFNSWFETAPSSKSGASNTQSSQDSQAADDEMLQLFFNMAGFTKKKK